MSESTHAKAEYGMKARMALDAISLAVWEECSQVILKAEIELRKGELTPESSHLAMIRLLEQRRLVESLAGRVEAGISANERISKSFEADTVKARRELRRGNRFARSRVEIATPNS